MVYFNTYDIRRHINHADRENVIVFEQRVEPSPIKVDGERVFFVI